MTNLKGGFKHIIAILLFSLFTNSSLFAQCPTAACLPNGFIGSTYQLGTTNFTLNTINHNTFSRSGGDPTYVDYSCVQNTTLLAGNSYSISIFTTSTNLMKAKVWIDVNNDGFFNDFTEAFFAATTFGPKNGTITIPLTGVVQNIPLRLRVACDDDAMPPLDPCTNPIWGQMEDYSVTIVSDTNPPASDFEASDTVLCSGSVSFTDLSTKNPDSWFWDFGDGNTDTTQNPTHTYASSGFYTVTLITANAFGSDTMVKVNYIDNTAVGPTIACVPGTASNAGNGANAGIYNFTLNTINNTSAGDIDGYKDYSCALETVLFEGTPYSVSITTGASADEYVKIWADLNNDGTFQASEELFFSTARTNHSGTITIPSGAQLDTALRLRVSADITTSPVPTACSTPLWSQVEDYSIKVVANNNPPAADFESNELTTCDGTVSFKDLSINGATSWYWDFGDGNSSTNKNPNHTYLSTGTYTVKLVVTNANGSDSIIKTDYITYHDTIPTSACTPVTNSYCCGYGITNFSFGTINNATEDGSAGYEDFTCTIRTRVTEGQSYPIAITTGFSGNQDTKVWIDYNDDGQFTDSTERVFTALNTKNPTGSIIISNNTVFDTPLRMRVISDFYNSSFNPCFNVIHGQAEDYTVIIESNQALPIANFNGTPLISCDSVFTFYDSSLNSPDSYLWDFGDGNTDTVQNPTHAYANPGTYTITLIVTNEIGSDTITKTDYVSYNPSPTAACVPTTVNYCCNTGVNRFILETIDNFSGNASTPYEDFSCLYFTTVKAGESYPVSVRTGNQLSEHVVIWIDLNNDGEFDNSTEQVYSNTGFLLHTGNVEIPRIAVYDTSLRLRIGTERSSSPVPSGCSNLFNGQYEDYAIVLTEPDSIPVDTNTNDTTDTLAVAQNMLQDVELYPNPASNQLFVENSTEETIQSIMIINNLGEVVLEVTPQNQPIDISKLSGGAYIVSIRSRNEIVNRKLIINDN